MGGHLIRHRRGDRRIDRLAALIMTFQPLMSQSGSRSVPCSPLKESPAEARPLVIATS